MLVEAVRTLDVDQRSAFLSRSERATLSRDAHRELEDLRQVVLLLHEREAKVECDGSRTHQRHRDSHSEADRQTKFLQAGFVPLDRAKVGEANHPQSSVGGDRNQVFRTTQEHELTADASSMIDRTDAAVCETSHRLEAASEVMLVDWSIGTGPRRLQTQRQDVSTVSIRSLEKVEVLVSFAIDARIVELTKGLLEAARDVMSGTRLKRRIARVVSERDAPGRKKRIPQHSFQ